MGEYDMAFLVGILILGLVCVITTTCFLQAQDYTTQLGQAICNQQYGEQTTTFKGIELGDFQSGKVVSLEIKGVECEETPKAPEIKEFDGIHTVKVKGK